MARLELRETMPADELAGDGRRTPAVERVLEHILGEMDQGRLRPGSRVNAARVAATLDLSVAPVREALCMLAGRGVLDLLPDRGAVMRALTPEDVVQIWGVLTPIAAVGLDLAARAIAAGADGADITAKYRILAHGPLAVSPLAFILRLNDYHWAVNELGGNPYVSIAIDRLGLAYWDRYLIELIDVHAHIDGYLTNYRRMHEAVIAGDGPAATAVVRHHAQWSIGLIREAAAGFSRRGLR